MEVADTEHVRPLFMVKEFADGAPYLSLETRGESPPPELARIVNALLFALKDGTTYDQARDLASTLNNMVATVGMTTFFGEAPNAAQPS